MIQFSKFMLLSALVVAALAAGCATVPAPKASAEPVEGAASEERDARDESLPRDAGSVASLIGDGRYDEARALLEARLARTPEDRRARSLLHQLTVDAQAVLGPPVSEHIVVAGDSLSALADRYLGDPQLYVLLARYNGIKRPRALTVGQRIALPRQSEAAKGNDPSSREWQQRGIEAEARNDVAGREQALAAYEHALSIRPDLEPAKTRRAALRTALVEDYHRAGVVHFRNQRIDEALALWDRALAIDPDFEPALGYRTRALEIKRRLDHLEQEQPR